MMRRTVLLSALAWIFAVAHAGAQDRPSAVLLYPYVVANSTVGLDTLVQLTNVSEDPLNVSCLYEDLTPQCVAGTTGESCGPGPVTCSGTCQPQFSRTSFPVRLTPRQPLAWRLSQGLVNAPLDGVERLGVDGASNEGTAVPAITAPMVGTLRCVVVAADPSQPIADNALAGLATITEGYGSDAKQYRALGFRSLDGTVPNNDEFLRLGGVDGEYESCPALISIEHAFDDGPLLTSGLTAHVESGIVLSSCSTGPIEPGRTVAQFLVHNEFGQRFSTSRAIRGQLITRLANIDTTVANRSIFSVAVAGTLAGQTLIRSVDGGLVGIGNDTHVYANDQRRSVAYNLQAESTRTDGDYIAYRFPSCVGDCNLDGRVRVNELVSGVNIALGSADVSACRSMDQNRNDAVTVNELVQATNSAIGACPSPMPPPTPLAEQVVPRGEAVPGAPQITVLTLASADDRPLTPDATDAENRPVFTRPYGQGMTIVVEAQNRTRPVGRSSFNSGGLAPDLQVLVSRPLGDGNAAVCEDDGVAGGVPGNPTLDFSAEGAVEAMNDLGCRAFERQAPPQGFTRPEGARDVWRFVSSDSQLQWGIPIAKAWAFPIGDTIVAARVRDSSGTLSVAEELVVRVTPP